MPSPYSKACRENFPASTCRDCFRPMRWAKDLQCDGCVRDRSNAGVWLTKVTKDDLIKGVVCPDSLKLSTN